ncbi:hypothetical protein HAZT_HAZT008472 [Hyalella azteca]|uniref:Neuropeptide F n=1 Tax=Hyalella azteca TaxID=294128 RepID=A0A6A0H0A5_HYAAZ|nr:hypothetical protein HAZT_HAZT008472 [Hyalella azteca]
MDFYFRFLKLLPLLPQDLANNSTMVSVQKVPVSVSAVLVLSVVLSLLSGTLVDARPEPAQLVAMADALKYLHQLDKYYSQVARPR